jgi:flagellin-like protein
MVQMSNRYLSKKTKTRKGISPVIATVILVAVAVVIAAALAGFSSSLFGSYSQNAQLSITSLTVACTACGTLNGDGSMVIVNSGGSADTVSSVAIQNYGSAAAAADVYLDDPGTAPTIPANGQATITFVNLDDSTGAGSVDLVSGQSVTVAITTTSGQQFTLSTIVV